LLKRRTFIATAPAALLALTAKQAAAASAAEDFIARNIQRGFDILNDTSLASAERRSRFAAFLLDLTDMRRVALFLLGKYAAGASAAQIDAFVDAFRDYSLAVYQSYFAQYAGQTLKVTGSRQRAPGDDIVSTTLTGGVPTEVDFRVRSDGAKPVLVDIAVAGVWLGLAERDEFASVLARSNGDIGALIAHLRAAQAQYH
jgi:phospholipid transport system substrate-binding protein